eukprot:SAG11_NODE_31296_length_293_cov_0.731959_1_plen_31_part_10
MAVNLAKMKKKTEMLVEAKQQALLQSQGAR